MKIIQLIDTLSLGGAERMSINIANVLSERGIESYLVSTRKSGQLLQFLLPQVKYFTLNKKHGLDIWAFYKLLRLVKKINPNIIHAHSTSIYWAVVIRILFPRINVIWHDHFGLSNQIEKHPRNQMKLISRWIYAVIAVNDTLKFWAQNNLKVNPSRIVYIENFPYLQIKTKQPKENSIILHLANFRPQKDHLTLIKALSILKANEVKFFCHMAGNLGDKTYMEFIYNQIAELELNDFIKILGPVEDVSKLLSEATLGIICSISEGLPVALLEYGLAGLPVVCTDVGQCAHVLKNGKYGWVVPPGNPNVMALAIMEILNNPQPSLEKGLKLKKHIEQDYGADGFIHNYYKLIKVN